MTLTARYPVASHEMQDPHLLLRRAIAVWRPVRIWHSSLCFVALPRVRNISTCDGTVEHGGSTPRAAASFPRPGGRRRRDCVRQYTPMEPCDLPEAHPVDLHPIGPAHVTLHRLFRRADGGTALKRCRGSSPLGVHFRQRALAKAMRSTLPNGYSSRRHRTGPAGSMAGSVPEKRSVDRPAIRWTTIPEQRTVAHRSREGEFAHILRTARAATVRR